MSMPKVYGEVYGCSANIADHEIMTGLLKQAGFEFVDSLDEADINLITTCIVKTPTEQRMIHRIKELTKTKKPLIVAGCMGKVEGSVVENFNPQASLVGPDSLEKIVDVANATLQGKREVFLEHSKKPKVGLPQVYSKPPISIIEILSGCLSNCSFCQTKLARGNLFSYPVAEIVNQIRTAKNVGLKEFWLTSQDNSCYGLEHKINLAILLEEVSKIEGKFYVRVGMMSPLHLKKILARLVNAFKNEKIFKFLHLPLQSGSDDVLAHMKRGYTVTDFLEYVEAFKKEIPELMLATDVIVGYPTETEEDFKKTVDVIKKIRPDFVNVSKFWPRPGTSASKLKQLDREIVSKRSAYMYRLVKKIAFENNKKWIGWKGKILVDEKTAKGFVGRNFTYRPVAIQSDKNVLGKIADIEIISATQNCLIAK